MSLPCPNCGRVNRPGARYCASCQSPLSVTAARLQPGQLLNGGAYRVVRALGKGGMGAVWLVAQPWAFDRLAVLKEVIDYFDPDDADAREKAAQRFEAEARTLGDLRHPGIPDLYAFFSELGHNYLVMEFIDGEDLSRGLTREDSSTGRLVAGGALVAEQVLDYMIQICKVLEYLANQQPPVVHNDIKPGNIIIDRNSGQAVLVDFGTAKTRYLQATGSPDEKKTSIYGTVGYAAPELYQGHSESRSDVFSLAATAYHLLTDNDPRDHPFKYPLLDTLPADLAGILRTALAEDLQDRPSASEFREQMESFLGGQTAPLRALAFPDGDSVDEIDELVSMTVKHWRHAANLLQDGTMAAWLRRTLRDPMAAEAAEAAVKHWPNDPDAALDAFVRSLNPTALPPGKMELRTASLRLQGMSAKQKIQHSIEIANRGRGFLRGEILVTQPWVKASSLFSCPPGRTCVVPIEIDTSRLMPGQSHLAAVTLTPVGGAPEVVPVQVSMGRAPAAPASPGPGKAAIKLNRSRVDFGTVSPNKLSTTTERITVSNVGPVAARVHVQGAPRWLLVKPESFHLIPGSKQVVKFVGRVDKISDPRQKLKLNLALDGGDDQEIEVQLKIRRKLFG